MAERLGYQPALDGIRAIAVTLVVLYHYPTQYSSFSANPVHGGFLGVDGFFVLSGFLITTLLLQEHATYATVNLRNFYARRAYRLLPALGVLLVISIGLSLFLAHKDSNRPQLTGLFGMVFYVANWVNIYRPRALGIAADTWSLAIEEQFYVVWPMVLLFLLRRHLRMRTIALATAGGIALSATWRAWYWVHHRGAMNVSNVVAAFLTGRHRRVVWNRIYFGSDTRADALLAGCLTALLLFWFLPRLGARARARLSRISWLALAAAAVIVSRAVTVDSGWLPEWGFLVFAICIAALIAGLVAAPRGLLAGAFGFPPLAWLGRRSYAIYLFHQLLFASLRRSRVHLSPPLSFAFQMAAILVVAELSFRLVEAPMLRRKRRFEPAPATSASPL